MKNKFWIENPSILFKNNNYMIFFPTSEMSRAEQLNAITRLCVYYIILLLLLGKGNEYLMLPFLVIIFIIVIYYIYKNDSQGKYDDFVNRKFKKNKEKKVREDDTLEAGFYDFDGKLKFGEYNNYNKQALIDQQAKDVVNYDYNELLEYEKEASRKPTVDNPFMNPVVTDFNTENAPPAAANADDDEIKNDIERKFNTDLYRNLTDLFDVKNSQRIWYTVPVTSIPSAQDNFANWLYNTDNICKVNQGACLRYEDLRFKR